MAATLSQQTLIEYRDALLAKGVKVTTVNKSVSTLSTFFKWALSIGLLDTNFARRIRLPQMVRKKRLAGSPWKTFIGCSMRQAAKRPSFSGPGMKRCSM